MADKRPRSDTVDVLILSEGAYPYVSGGVSSWVQTMLTNFSNITFGIVFLGSFPHEYDGMKYKFPDNVIDFQEHYLFDYPEEKKGVVKDINEVKDQCMQQLHDWFKNPTDTEKKTVINNMIDLFDVSEGITQEQFLHTPQAWNYITHCYEEYSTEPSFIDYFWTVKNMHAPLWKVAKMVRSLPKAKLIHSVATGYAGFLAALLKTYKGYPLLLSEHGIYTKERRIELLQSNIVKEQNKLTRTEDVDYLRRMWMRFFESLAVMCYELSDDITALFYDASEKQNSDGADKNKQHIIPNAIHVNHLKKYRKTRPRDKKRICLLGRVVPIKDIKTFIRAIKYLTAHDYDFDVWVVGPKDEDKEYAKECEALVTSLDLTGLITFKGLMTLDEVIPEVDVMVISSISEGMPLVILEGYAAGIPAVSTNVGSCEEMINGATDDDKAIGPSGRVVKISSPKDLAEGILDLLDNQNWQAASEAAVRRVERYYNLPTVLDAYAKLYQKHGVM
jgi:glycosyltransferase involved in cell wall biosynthesis